MYCNDYICPGCMPRPCPRGQIHGSETNLTCIPVSECPAAVCMTVDDVVYAEGDVMEKDACHSWYFFIYNLIIFNLINFKITNYCFAAIVRKERKFAKDSLALCRLPKLRLLRKELSPPHRQLPWKLLPRSLLQFPLQCALLQLLPPPRQLL